MLNDFVLNEIEIDEFKRTSGVLAINKPAGITSHDVVDRVRRRLRTRKVGHAGALDPFASGVLMVMVGKYTKLSERIMNNRKEYKCEVLFGISTDTLDPEGQIDGISEEGYKLDESDIKKIEKEYKDGYEQVVPIYSSVKVEGYTLRKLVRKAESFSVDEQNNATFVMKDGSKVELKLPKRKVEFDRFEVGGVKVVGLRDLEEGLQDKLKELVNAEAKFSVLPLTVGCSKGTYIRQLAQDIGKVIVPICPSMLISLERTRLGEVSLEECVEVDSLPEL